MPSRRSQVSLTPKTRPLPPLALTFEELEKPSIAQEARLLRAAQQLWALAPWKSWAEDEIWVIQDPENNDLGFVSVIGGSKQQFGVILYRGADAYFGLLDFIERASLSAMPPWINEAPDALKNPGVPTDFFDLMRQMQETMVDPTELLNISQLHLDFDARSQLDPLDKEWLKRHNYNAKGRGFPSFRAFTPGYLPWWVDAGEAQFLTLALEQLIELCERSDFSHDALSVKTSGRQKPAHELFARLPQIAPDKAVQWRDARLKVSPGEAFAVELDPDEELLERLLALPQGRANWEIELVSLPTPVGDEQNRPFFPSVLLLGHDDQVLASQMIPCGSPSPYLLAPLLNAILDVLAAQKERPAKLQFASPEMALVQVIGEMTGIAVEWVEELPTLDAAAQSLLDHLEGDESFGDWEENENGENEKKPPRLH